MRSGRAGEGGQMRVRPLVVAVLLVVAGVVCLRIAEDSYGIQGAYFTRTVGAPADVDFADTRPTWKTWLAYTGAALAFAAAVIAAVRTRRSS